MDPGSRKLKEAGCVPLSELQENAREHTLHTTKEAIRVLLGGKTLSHQPVLLYSASIEKRLPPDLHFGKIPRLPGILQGIFKAEACPCIDLSRRRIRRESNRVAGGKHSYELSRERNPLIIIQMGTPDYWTKNTHFVTSSHTNSIVNLTLDSFRAIPRMICFHGEMNPMQSTLRGGALGQGCSRGDLPTPQAGFSPPRLKSREVFI